MAVLDPPCANQGAPAMCGTPHLSESWQKVPIKGLGFFFPFPKIKYNQ